MAANATKLTPSTIVVNAYGQSAGNVWPHFRLVVDGVDAGEATAGSGSSSAYTFRPSLAAGTAHKIEIRYDNDDVVGGQDRNLFVQSVVVNGNTLKPAQASYDRNDLDGKDVITGQEAMLWKGALAFQTPASYYPTPAATPTPATGESATIVVKALGTAAGGKYAHFNLLVDGAKVGEATVGAAAKDFTFTTKVTPDAAHKVQIQYDNDAVVNGQDRNLTVEAITINGKSVQPTDSIVRYDRNALDGKDVLAGQKNMPWGGTLVVSADKGFFPKAAITTPPPPPAPQPPATGSDTLVIKALGTVADGVFPHFIVTVDGVRVGDAYATGTAKEYSFKANLAQGKAHDIKITFDNDHATATEDRNLTIQSIGVGGRTVLPTDPHATYATAGQGVLPGQSVMGWSGTLDLNLPASYFGGGTTVEAPSAYHVSLGGSDANDGSAARPFASLARAAEAMTAGSIKTTLVHGGTYDLSAPVTLKAANSGVTFKAAAGETPILDGGNARLGTLMTLDGASNVSLKGLTFADTESGGHALVLKNAAFNQITANHFVDTGTGIRLIGSSNNKVSGNQIDQSAQSGVEVQDNSNYNTFDSNVIDGTGAPNTQGGGFFMHGVNYNMISHNLVKNTAGMGIGVENWDDYTVNVGNTVQYNIVKNANTSSYDSGSIYALGRSHVDTKMTIKYNLVDGTGGADMHTIGIYLDDSTSGANVYGNVVRNVGTHAVEVHGGDDNTLQNNIFDLGSGRASAVLFQSAPADTDPKNSQLGNLMTKNIVYSTGATSKVFDYIDGGSPEILANLYYNTRGASMQTASPTKDLSPTYGDPGFADASAGDYALSAKSAAHAIGFEAIPYHDIGLNPTTETWY